MPGKETKRDHPLVWQVEQVHSVYDLTGRYDQVDDTEVVLQSMTDKRDAVVNEEAKLQIRRLERRQVFRRRGNIQVTGLDSRELGQVIDHLILRRYVVVNER